MVSISRPLVVVALGGLAVGVLSVLAAERVDRVTSTQEFCGNACHSMRTYVAGDETFQKSAHRTAESGVVATCADCHIPKGLVPATWAHITAGARDLFSEITHDFEDPEEWRAIQPQLADRVRQWLVATDSATCRSCHVEDAIKPRRMGGKRQHEVARKEGLTCIVCHTNLVHGPPETR